MTKTDQEKEDEVLRRMLKTPPKPHKAKGAVEKSNLARDEVEQDR